MTNGLLIRRARVRFSPSPLNHSNGLAHKQSSRVPTKNRTKNPVIHTAPEDRCNSFATVARAREFVEYVRVKRTELLDLRAQLMEQVRAIDEALDSVALPDAPPDPVPEMPVESEAAAPKVEYGDLVEPSNGSLRRSPERSTAVLEALRTGGPQTHHQIAATIGRSKNNTLSLLYYLVNKGDVAKEPGVDGELPLYSLAAKARPFFSGAA